MIFSNDKTGLQRVSSLYITAAICTLMWLPTLYLHRVDVVDFVSINIFYLGYIAMFVWGSMLCISLYLLYVGIRIRRQLSGDVVLSLSYSQRMMLKSVRELLVVGIIADVAVIGLLLSIDTDGMITVFFSVIMGGRVLQANLMAIQLYHNVH